jgi:hypothetical protein
MSDSDKLRTAPDFIDYVAPGIARTISIIGCVFGGNASGSQLRKPAKNRPLRGLRVGSALRSAPVVIFAVPNTHGELEKADRTWLTCQSDDVADLSNASGPTWILLDGGLVPLA